jgi:hypothetical protein
MENNSLHREIAISTKRETALMALCSHIHSPGNITPYCLFLPAKCEQYYYTAMYTHTALVHQFSKKLEANSKLQMPAGWHEASSTLKTHKY